MFRFTIRDVLWLTVVVGMGVGWWADRCKAELARDRDMQQLLQQEGLLDSIEQSLSVPNVNPGELRGFVKTGRQELKRFTELWQGDRPPVIVPSATTPQE